MTITEANAVNTLLHWAMGTVQPYFDHPTDAEATEAAQHLTGKAYKALGAGLRPDQVALTRAGTVAALRGINALFGGDHQ